MLLKSVWALLLLGVVVSASSVPAWVTKSLNRGGRRGRSGMAQQVQATKDCSTYANSRCKFGSCILKNAGYEDTVENFVNEKHGPLYYCLCRPGYETLYPGNSPPIHPNNFVAAAGGNPEKLAQSWCNAEKNICANKNTNPCIHGGKCVQTGAGTAKCVCNKYWIGDICEKDVNECAKCETAEDECPCKNGGGCQNRQQSVNYPFGFNCRCQHGTTGLFCERITDPCAREPCLPEKKFGGAIAGAACEILGNGELNLDKPETLFGFKCKCESGWGGLKCGMRQGTCDAATSCSGHGLCETDPNFPGFFQCTCDAGYTHVFAKLGENKFCSQEIDLCASSPCKNEGTCIFLGANEKKCVCKPGFTGPYCETMMDPCYSSTVPKCLHKGKCSATKVTQGSRPSGTSYTCDCTKTGYKGTICQESVAECEQNDPYMCDQTGSSKCEELENGYNCVCKPGYIKTQQDMSCKVFASGCSTESNRNAPCLLGSKCSKGPSMAQNYQCDCGNILLAGTPLMAAATLGDPSSQTCDKIASTSALVHSSFAKDFGVTVTGSKKKYKMTGDVWIARRGGLQNDPYLKLISGSLLLAKADSVKIPTTSTISLFFMTTGTTSGNLLTIYDAAAKKCLFMIKPGPRGENLQVIVASIDPPVVVDLPKHSRYVWNHLAVTMSHGEPYPSMNVYLNTLLIATKELRNFDFIAQNDIILGTDNLEDKGPFFNGGVAQFMVFNKALEREDLVDNLGTWSNLKCKMGCLDFNFRPESLYKDDGCFHFDATPVNCQIPSKTWKTTYKPIMNINLANFEETSMKIENYPFLFAKSPKKFGWMIEFIQINQPSNGVFKSLAYSGPKDPKEAVLNMGTLLDGTTYKFIVKMQTSKQTVEASAVLTREAKDCIRVWRVVVDFDTTSSENNLVLYTRGQGVYNDRDVATTYSMQGTLEPTAVTKPLFLGYDQEHYLATFRFNAGDMFTEKMRKDFLAAKNQEQGV